MAIADLKSNVADVMNSASDKLINSLSFLKDVKEAGAEKISGLVNDILGLAPLIEATGFNMSRHNKKTSAKCGGIFYKSSS